MDELLRQDGKKRDEYAQLNNKLSESVDGEEEIESTKDEATESTTMEDKTRDGKLKESNSIERDNKELIELIKEFRRW